MDLSKCSTICTETNHGVKRDFVKLEVSGFQELGYFLESIISVCKSGILYDFQNDIISDGLQYCKLLELAQNLIPHSEFEELDNEMIRQRKTAKP